MIFIEYYPIEHYYIYSYGKSENEINFANINFNNIIKTDYNAVEEINPNIQIYFYNCVINIINGTIII